MASVKCIIKDDYVQKDGLSAIRIRVTVLRQKYEYGLDLYESQENFDKSAGRVRRHKLGPGMCWEDMNHVIEQEIAKCQDIIYHFKRSGVILTLDMFKQEKYRGRANVSFLDFMEQQIAEIKMYNYFEKDTIQGYENTLRKLRSFRKEVLFCELTYDFVDHFDKWMLGVCNNDTNTRWKNHKNLRKFINEGIRHGIKISSPYLLYKPAKVAGSRTFLTHAELQRLIGLYGKWVLPDHLQCTLARYLFSFYACGMRYSDTQRASWDNYEEGHLKIFPHKTKRYKKILIIPLHRDCLRYIQNKVGLFFASKSDAVLNIQLKEICRLAGIRKNITFHTARHTFATWYLDNGGRVEVLQHLMGHSKLEDTMVYVHITEAAKRDSIRIFDDLLRDIILLSECSEVVL